MHVRVCLNACTCISRRMRESWQLCSKCGIVKGMGHSNWRHSWQSEPEASYSISAKGSERWGTQIDSISKHWQSTCKKWEKEGAHKLQCVCDWLLHRSTHWIKWWCKTARVLAAVVLSSKITTSLHEIMVNKSNLLAHAVLYSPFWWKEALSVL